MKAATFLMFQGDAEQAIDFYTSVIPDIQVKWLNTDTSNGGVRQGHFEVEGQRFMFIDSPVKHQFGFTPSMSIYLTCGNEEEIDTLFANLSEGGSVMMPLAAYPFSKKYAWLSDKFGVSWQLSLG
jgi:predicted 3-demethylubiquinone-9 3-methyltransferase (glyoxalase superfamily)